MRVLRFIALITLLCTTLCGCQRTGEVENQAYALILGIDKAPDGLLRLTARVPQVGNSGAEAEKGTSGGKYLTFSAEGTDWASARNALEIATPRPLNLSHIVLLVVSREMASDSGFAELLRCAAEMPHLYTTAKLAVCDGRADAFVDAQEAVVGTRLSADLNATLAHYAKEGAIPDCSLADFYYAVDSVYSDPVAISAGLSPESADTPMRQRYEGASLFRDGALTGALDARETRALCLTRGEVRSINLDCDGHLVELTVEGKPSLDVDTDESGALLRVDVRFSTLDALGEDRIQSVIYRLQSDIMHLIFKCQGLGVEPFGFSERAAAKYATTEQFVNSGWRRSYESAHVDVRVHIDAKRDMF